MPLQCQSVKPTKHESKGLNKIAAVDRFFLHVPWSLSYYQLCERNLGISTKILNFGLDTTMPVRSVRVHETDRPWLNSHLKVRIARHQKSFASGNTIIYRLLGNKVNRDRKRCRKAWYVNKIEDLRENKPHNWLK